MARRTWVYIDGVAYERGVDIIPEVVGQSAPAFIPDTPDFVSPIDGSVVSGRKGLREHCLRHDVVPTQELAGLPTRMPEHKPSAKEVRERREMIYAQVDKARQRGEL